MLVPLWLTKSSLVAEEEFQLKAVERMFVPGAARSGLYRPPAVGPLLLRVASQNGARIPDANSLSFDVVSQSWFDLMTGAASFQSTADARKSVRMELEAAIDSDPNTGSIAERIKTMDDAYTATRAGYLDELGAANIPADLDEVKTDTAAMDTSTEMRTLLTGSDTAVAKETSVDDLEGRLTAARATKIDNLDATISSRSSHSTGDILDTTVTGHTTAGTLGWYISKIKQFVEALR